MKTRQRRGWDSQERNKTLQVTSTYFLPVCLYVKKKQTAGIFQGNTQEKGKEKHLESISDPPVVGQANNWERKRGSNNFPQYDLSCFSESPLVRHCVGWNAWKQEVWFKKHLFNQHFLLTGTTRGRLQTAGRAALWLLFLRCHLEKKVHLKLGLRFVWVMTCSIYAGWLLLKGTVHSNIKSTCLSI